MNRFTRPINSEARERAVESLIEDLVTLLMRDGWLPCGDEHWKSPIYIGELTIWEALQVSLGPRLHVRALARFHNG